MNDITTKIEGIIDDFITRLKDMNPQLLIRINNKTAKKDDLFNSFSDYLEMTNTQTELRDPAKKRLEAKIFGYDILQELIDDDEISDIRVFGPNSIYTKRRGAREKISHISFKSLDDYNNFISQVVIKNNSNLGYSNAIIKFTDTISSQKFLLRIDITSELLTFDRVPFMHIRKHPRVKRSFNELEHAVPEPMLTPEISAFLSKKMKDGSSLIVSGPNGAGKTQFLNAAIEELPELISGLCVQETDELFSNTHKNILFCHTLETRESGYSLKDMIKQGLIEDVDVYILGEIRDEAALYTLNAAYTGSQCLLTCHAESSLDAIQKLSDYAMYEAKYSIEMVQKEMACMDMIVYIEDYQVVEITLIRGYNDESKSIIYDKIYDKKLKMNRIANFM